VITLTLSRCFDWADRARVTCGRTWFCGWCEIDIQKKGAAVAAPIPQRNFLVLYSDAPLFDPVTVRAIRRGRGTLGVAAPKLPLRSLGKRQLASSVCRVRGQALFGNPAVFPLREDPWLCDPASQRVCRFGRRCLFQSYPSIASPSGDNQPHNNSGQ